MVDDEGDVETGFAIELDVRASEKIKGSFLKSALCGMYVSSYSKLVQQA